MSNLSHFLTAATLGSNTPKMIGSLPLNDSEVYTAPNAPSLNQFQYDGMVKSREMMTNMQFSPNGSANGSILCAGIMPNNTAGVGTRTLRQEALDPTQGIYAPSGYGNAQPAGLASLPGKPMNVSPILNSVSQMNPSLINPISLPGFFNGSYY